MVSLEFSFGKTVLTNAPTILYNYRMPDNDAVKDSIPRIRIDQLFDSLHLIAISKPTSTFNEVRLSLYRSSKRQAPPSREVMWTVARDVLIDLNKLGLIEVGPLPRKRSEVERAQETPCKITEKGAELARLYKESPGKAFDAVLLAWMDNHPYFRAFTIRLLSSPMHIPDVTSIKQLGQNLKFPLDPAILAERITESCTIRLQAINFPAEKRAMFSEKVNEQIEYLNRISSMREIDVKKIIDTVEDNIVVPAILKSEGLSFDSVTFQHLMSCSQDFYSAAITSSHPDFTGRVLFSTCDFIPDPLTNANASIAEVIHHGQSYVSNRFKMSLVSAYKRLAGSLQTYIDIYPLRALVCTDLRIQPLIFSLGLEKIIEAGQESGMSVYTELPFTPPPQGESYVQVRGHRIGLLKLSLSNGG